MSPVATALPPLDHDPWRIRELVARILADPAYAEQGPGPIRRALARLGDALARIIADVVTSVTDTPVWAWIVVLLGAALLGAVVWRITRTASVDRDAAAVPDAPIGRSSDDWRAEARDHAAAGRRTEALRARYRAAVTSLTEAGVLDEVPGRTVTELDAAIAVAAPTVAPTFAAAGRAFADVWYGDVDPTDDHDAAIAAADDAARSLGRSPTRSGSS